MHERSGAAWRYLAISLERGETVMNTQCTSRKTSSQTLLSACHRLIAIGLLSLALAACGGSGAGPATSPDPGSPAPGPGDGPIGGAPGGDPTLDCVQEDYPCSFDEVALPVIERSLALSDEVAAQLEGGMEIEQVAALLVAQGDVVDVTVDGPVLAFRLAGGRPMIVDVTAEQEFLPATVATDAPASDEASMNPIKRLSPGQMPSTIRSVVISAISGGNKAQRHALVLSPYRFEENFGNAGELIAEALNGVRGYTGNVTYLATTNELDPKVTVDVLTRLQDYDVIHIDTHGGTICKDKDLPPSKELVKGSEKEICEGGVTDFLVQRFHGTAQDLQSIAHPGVVHYRGRLHQSIAVTADFFRHYYPDGLEDRLFILASCNTFRPDMANAIAGRSGVFMSWDGKSDLILARNSGLALLDSLGKGLTVGEAHERLPEFTPGNPGSQGSRLHYTARRVGGDLRIRDLLTVRDNLTGLLVTDASGIEVMEVPGDGQKDNLDLEFTVDGITPEQLASFYVNLVIDDHVIGHLNLKQSGVQVGDFRYRVSTPVPLPFDNQEGQTLTMDFWIPLPDFGEDHYQAAPRVNGRDEPEFGTEWVLSSRATRNAIDDMSITTASVVFEIDPYDDPDGDVHYFLVRSGSVQFHREYEDARGCHFNVRHTINIPPGAASNYLRFEAGSQKLTLTGFGSVPSEAVEATGECGSAIVNVGGAYFIAEETLVSGDSVAGGYNSGTRYPTIIDWTLSRTR
jgi:hypothetical protein